MVTSSQIIMLELPFQLNLTRSRRNSNCFFTDAKGKRTLLFEHDLLLNGFARCLLFDFPNMADSTGSSGDKKLMGAGAFSESRNV